MARTLIIKNADFSANKVTTVNIEDEVPCTGISLNNNTLSITHIGDTSTLVATVAPVNTTDTVIWSSSNADVATVAGGVVTAIGCGSATIAATCGNYSATCSVTVTHIAVLTFTKNMYLGKSASTDYLNGGALDNYVIGYSAEGSKWIYSDNMARDKHPFVIPNGANSITIDSQSFRPYGFWISSIEGAASWNAIAKAYPADPNFAYSASVENHRVVQIPDRTTGDYAGMDAVGFVFKCTTTLTDELIDGITVTFTA